MAYKDTVLTFRPIGGWPLQAGGKTRALLVSDYYNGHLMLRGSPGLTVRLEGVIARSAAMDNVQEDEWVLKDAFVGQGFYAIEPLPSLIRLVVTGGVLEEALITANTDTSRTFFSEMAARSAAQSGDASQKATEALGTAQTASTAAASARLSAEGAATAAAEAKTTATGASTAAAEAKTAAAEAKTTATGAATAAGQASTAAAEAKTAATGAKTTADAAAASIVTIKGGIDTVRIVRADADKGQTLSQAVNAAAATSGPILVSEPGTSAFGTTPVSLPMGTRLRGASKAGTVWKVPAISNVSAVTMASDGLGDGGNRSYISDFTLDGPGRTSTTDGFRVASRGSWVRDVEIKNFRTGVTIPPDNVYLTFWSNFGIGDTTTAINYLPNGSNSGEHLRFDFGHIGNSNRSVQINGNGTNAWNHYSVGVSYDYSDRTFYAAVNVSGGFFQARLSSGHIEYNSGAGQRFIGGAAGVTQAGMYWLHQQEMIINGPKNLFGDGITEAFVRVSECGPINAQSQGSYNFPDGVFVAPNPVWAPGGKPNKLSRGTFDTYNVAWDDRPNQSRRDGGCHYANYANGTLTIWLPFTWQPTTAAGASIQARIHFGGSHPYDFLDLPPKTASKQTAATGTPGAAGYTPLLPGRAGDQDYYEVRVPAGCRVSFEWSNVTLGAWLLSYFG